MSPTNRKQILPDLIRSVLVSWLFAVCLEWFLFPASARNLSSGAPMPEGSLLRVLAITVVGTALLLTLARRRSCVPVVRLSALVLTTVLLAAALFANRFRYFAAACALLVLAAAVYAVRGWRTDTEPEPEPRPAGKIWAWLTALLALGLLAGVSAWGVWRVRGLSVSSFDFGLFRQMFYSMTKTGRMLTTLERNGVLSHFAVHFSPIYYLLLPFYWLFPQPETLDIAQAAVMASAILPLWLLGKRHGLSGLSRTLLCLTLAAYPAFVGGAGYDLHENCFLTPLLLWLFYGLERRSLPITAVTALGVLLVKEDAAVYVAVVGLWLLARTLLRGRNRWDLAASLALLAVSIGWFLGVTTWLSRYGEGVMVNRYSNFRTGTEGSLFDVVRAVLVNPMKVVYVCVKREKLKFIFLTMAPLLGLPLLTRRYERWILLIPYVLVHLMSDYPYQHDVLFQYGFGPLACLFYLSLLNLCELRADRLRTAALAAAAIVSVGCFIWGVVPAVRFCRERAGKLAGTYQEVTAVFDRLPEDASVTAHTFYVLQLCDRDTVYDLSFVDLARLLESDYIIIHRNYSDELHRFEHDGVTDGLQAIRDLMDENGYVCDLELESGMTVYRKPALPSLAP